MRPDWIISLSCSGGVSVLSAGKSGLFYPHEGLIGSNPEVSSVVVWSLQSLALRSAHRNAHYLRELLTSRRAAAARYPVSHHMAAVRARRWESAAMPHMVFFMGVTEVNVMTLSCVGLCSCGASSETDAECSISVFL